MGFLSKIKEWLLQPGSANHSVEETVPPPTPASPASEPVVRDDSSFKYPIRKVARGLRYLTLTDLIGTEIRIQSEESAESDFLAATGDYVDHARASPPLIHLGGGTHVRYGFLDFNLPGREELLTGDAESGLSLIKSLGFISQEEDGPFLWPEDFEQMARDIEEKGTHLLLFMMDDAFPPATRFFPPRTESRYTPQFPLKLRITDACLSNSSHVWRWRHWYW